MSPLASANPNAGVVVQKPKSDVYTSLLFLSFLAILLAILCLYLEMKSYNMDMKAQEAQLRVGRASSQTAEPQLCSRQAWM